MGGGGRQEAKPRNTRGRGWGTGRVQAEKPHSSPTAFPPAAGPSQSPWGSALARLSSGRIPARRRPRHPVDVHAASLPPATCLDQFLAQGRPSGNICLGVPPCGGTAGKGVAEVAPDALKGGSGIISD